MIDTLNADGDVRAALGRLRSDGDQRAALARATWSVIAEPGDAVAGVLIDEFGPEEALQIALGGGDRSRPVVRAPKAVRALEDARARWRRQASSAAVCSALQSAVDIGARLVIPGDDHWPTALDDLGPQAPPALWVRGRAELLTTRPRVAVVGARAASGYGEHVAAEIAGDLAGTGATIVSGGAYGIDGVAHRAALGVDGATVAFLAGGVDRAYPAGHQGLLRRIADEGAVVSEPPCGAAPTRWRFLARNRLIAALGQATIVVEAGWRSGSLNTAGHAATLGRPLGAVPGQVTSASSAGCHRLLREYAAVCVTSAADVRELFESADVSSPAPAADPDRERLRHAMSPRSGREVQEIARRSGLSPTRVRALLGMAELDGEVMRDEKGWRSRRTAAAG